MSWWDDLLESITSGGGDTAESAAAAADAAGALSNVDYSALLGSGAQDFSANSWLDDLALTSGAAPEYYVDPLRDGQYASNTGAGPSAAGYAQRQGVGGLGTDGVAEPPGALTRVMQGLGIAGADGKVNYSDPKVMDRILKTVMTGGNVLNALLGGNKPKGYKSPAQLRAELAGPFNNWSPEQAAVVQGYFGRPISGPRALARPTTPPQSIVATPRYAEGGEVLEEAVDDSNPEFHSEGALSALVRGPGGGQDDLVPARLGSGEYVFDADVVAALGDGSNERGAEILDRWREEIRAHKRAAPAAEIPPRAEDPQFYLAQAMKGE